MALWRNANMFAHKIEQKISAVGDNRDKRLQSEWGWKNCKLQSTTSIIFNFLSLLLISITFPTCTRDFN
jgi:hypothetical protein